MARVFSGSNGSILYDFNSNDNSNVSDSFGVSVSGVGDVNGDGVPDFIVGAEDGGSNFQVHGHVRLFVSQTISLGDCNQDGEVNFLDITPFVGILSSGGFLEEGDANQDGVVNFTDITPFIEILTGN